MATIILLKVVLGVVCLGGLLLLLLQVVLVLGLCSLLLLHCLLKLLGLKGQEGLLAPRNLVMDLVRTAMARRHMAVVRLPGHVYDLVRRWTEIWRQRWRRFVRVPQ